VRPHGLFKRTGNVEAFLERSRTPDLPLRCVVPARPFTTTERLAPDQLAGVGNELATKHAFRRFALPKIGCEVEAGSFRVRVFRQVPRSPDATRELALCPILRLGAGRMVYGFAKKIGKIGTNGFAFPVGQMKGKVPVLAKLRSCFADPKIKEAASTPRTNPFSQQFNQVGNSLDGRLRKEGVGVVVVVKRRPANREKRIDGETKNGRALCRFYEIGLRTYRQAVRPFFWRLDCLGYLTDHRAQRAGYGYGAGDRPLPALAHQRVLLWVLVGTIRYR